MNKESREQRYLRILTFGVQSELDYEDAKYLIDKGYGNGKYSSSRSPDSYGKVNKVAWVGYTSNGLDFIDRLKEAIKSNHSQVIGNTKSDIQPNAVSNNVTKWHETSLGKIILGVFIGSILIFIKSHLD